MQPPDLNNLIDATVAGDKASYSLIVRRFQQPLFGFLGRMGLSQAQAEDVAQDAFIRAWRNLNGYDANRAQFSTWLFAIARNLALTELTHAKNYIEQATDQDLPDRESNDTPQADLMIERQRRDELAIALRQLPYDDRSSLALAYVNELDLASIARIEHCSVAAIKTRIHRAKSKLREILKDQQ